MNRDHFALLRDHAVVQKLTRWFTHMTWQRRTASITALAGIVWALTYMTANAVSTASEPVAAQPLLLVPADIVTVDTGSVAQGVKITGTLEPMNRTTVHARVNAVIDAVLVREGERVKQGQVLARQNSADVTAQLRQAEAQYVSASVELQLTEALEKRKGELFAKKYLSDADWAAAQGDTEVSRSNLKVRDAQVAMARRAAAETLITAPISGIVAERHVEPGSNLMPGQIVVTLVNLDELELAAAIPARDIPQVRIDSDVAFSVDGYPGETFHGKVTRINPMANGGARTITVYARVDNRDGRLRGGMFASGRLLTQKSASNTAVRIPANAVRHIDGKDQVWAIRDNKLALQEVTLGVRDSGNSLVEVRSGLAAGERIVLTDIGHRTDGMPVTVADAR